MRRATEVLFTLVVLCAPTPATARAARTDCNAPLKDAVTHVGLPSSPFVALPSADGCWIFVTLTPANGGTSGVAVLHRTADAIAVARIVPLESQPTGAVLTHDGKMMIIAGTTNIAFLDVAKLVSGEGSPVLGYIAENGSQGYIYANVSANDRYLFVSDETAAAITVVDLEKARTSGFAISSVIGRIPVGRAPIALTFSADERYMYTTSQVTPASISQTNECRPEGSQISARPNHGRGGVLIVDVARAITDPEHSVVGDVPIGCNTVRLVTSPKGDIAYVSARGDDNLIALSTAKLLSDPSHAKIGSVRIGTAPVGIAVFDQGNKLIVTSSNRFAGSANDKQFLTVVDATRIAGTKDAVIGQIPAGAFPRELRVAADGGTLLLTNFGSRTVEIVDLNRLAQAMKK